MPGGQDEETKGSANVPNKDLIFDTGELQLTPNSIKVLERRYFKKDDDGKIIEGPGELFKRVALNIAQADLVYDSEADIEATAKEFFEVMIKMDFLPNSPTLMNAGRGLQQLSACFVLPIHDSMESIFTTLKHTAMIHKSGGGTGFSFSALRPKDDMVMSTKGISSGPISFMTVFDQATEAIKQGGTRRGANMGILRIDHPDIESFITCKEDNDRLTNFNISVAITDRFMHALKNNEDYNIINPRTKDVIDRRPARKIFDKIVQNAWSNGEPGIIFIDQINKYNPTSKIGEIESTNPCVSGDSLIYTDDGMKRADHLYENPSPTSLMVSTDARINPVSRHLPATNVFKTGRHKVYILVTKEGYNVRLTSNHKVMTDQGWVNAGDLSEGDLVHIFTGKGDFNGKGDIDTGKVLGWFVANGIVKEDRIVLSFFGNEKQVLAQGFAQMTEQNVNAPIGDDGEYEFGITSIINDNEIQVSSKRFFDMGKEFGILNNDHGNDHGIPYPIMTSSEEFQRGFLQGLFTAKGSIQGDIDKGLTVTLPLEDLGTLEGVQLMLLNFQIACRIQKANYVERSPKMPDGSMGNEGMDRKDQPEIVISKDDLATFANKIGFLSPQRMERLVRNIDPCIREPHRKDLVATFDKLIENGTEEVYNLTVPHSNSYIANGFVVKNCGEQPLLPYESCNLGSINLSRMVRAGDTNPEVDWQHLRRVVETAVKFLDNVIDMNKYPLAEIAKTTRSNRKIGLGVMGFADLLVQLGIPYNSKEGLKMAEDVMAFIEENASRMSAKIADERGAFPNFKGSLLDKPDGPKVRNATVTTIAPTGTISIIAGCSSGIEPIFALVFERNVMDGTKMLEINKHFEEIARKEGFYSKELMERIARKGTIQDMNEIPEHVRNVFVTAHDITPEWHIRMQAAFQRSVDNAVSKTVNFPKNATKKDVEECYLLAYDLNCKGVTVYRDGSRDNQPMSVKGDAGAEGVQIVTAGGRIKVKPRPRPSRMKGSTVRMMTGCGKLYVTINEDEKGLFEVFSQMGKSGGCAMSQSEAISRLISLALRSGVEDKAILKQIKGIRCPSPFLARGGMILSCPDAIAKAVELYLAGKTEDPPIAEEATTLKHFEEKDASWENVVGVCPDCGNAVGYEEGCILCRFCGWSKCG